VNKLNPFAGNPNIPAVAEYKADWHSMCRCNGFDDLQSDGCLRRFSVSSVKTLQDAKVMKDCWYMPMRSGGKLLDEPGVSGDLTIGTILVLVFHVAI